MISKQSTPVKKLKPNKNALNYRVAIVLSRFNDEITNGLLVGALEVLNEAGIKFDQSKDLFRAPGAFELPLIAQTLASKKRYDGVIALGCVIKGDTAHFEWISQSAALGIMSASLAVSKPIGFGILTTYTEEQALIRSAVKNGKASHENKGREAALAVIDSIQILKSI